MVDEILCKSILSNKIVLELYALTTVEETGPK